jgi:hypothetical protein
MPTQEELAFIRAIVPMVIEEMKRTLAAGRAKKRPAVPARLHSTTAGGVTTASQRSSARPAGKRKSTELACSVSHRSPPTGALRPVLARHHCSR